MLSRRPSQLASLASTVGTAVCVVAPLCALGVALAGVVPSGWGEYDFRVFHDAARAVRSGDSPYPTAVEGDQNYVYPPLLAILLIPFGYLALGVAAIAFNCLSMTCIGTSLWLLGVRDWRCYSATVLWWPVVITLQLGTIGGLLLILVAAAWRFRHRAAAFGSLVSAAVALKLLSWPLTLWPLVSGRARAVPIGIGAGALLVLGPWAVIGFDGLAGYPQLLRELTDAEAAASASLYALVLALGGTTLTGLAATFGAGSVVLAFAVRVARSGHERADERAFSLFVCSALLLTPLLWPHYLIVLLAPVAVLRPRFGPMWLTAWALHFTQDAEWMNGRISEIVPSLALITLVTVSAAEPRILGAFTQLTRRTT